MKIYLIMIKKNNEYTRYSKKSYVAYCIRDERESKEIL